MSGGASTGGSALGGTPGIGGQPTTGGAPSGGETLEFGVNAELASDVSSSAPTTVGIVTFSMPEQLSTGVTSASIEFGLDDSYGMAAPVDLDAEEHRTLLLGMKPAQTYHFRVVVEAPGGPFVSADQTLQTGAATNLVNVQGFQVMNDAARERGFLVASFWRGDGSSVAFILDADGEVVWWYDSGMMGIARARMSADGKNMWLVEPDNQGAPVQRVSMDTLDEQTYSETVGSHDLTPVTGSTMAYLDYGESDCDSIFEIEPDGTVTEVWESQDVAIGMCHGNALRYSADEDFYTFSDVSTDIWVVSRAGEFQWGLADRVAGGVATWGGRNHGHHLLDDSLVIFANAGMGNMESWVVEYDLEGNEIWRYEGGAFSANLGDVQRLPGGNTLVTYSNDGIIHEVTPDKELVLSIDSGGPAFGYVLWRDSLYGEPDDLGL